LLNFKNEKYKMASENFKEYITDVLNILLPLYLDCAVLSEKNKNDFESQLKIIIDSRYNDYDRALNKMPSIKDSLNSLNIKLENSHNKDLEKICFFLDNSVKLIKKFKEGELKYDDAELCGKFVLAYRAIAQMF